MTVSTVSTTAPAEDPLGVVAASHRAALRVPLAMIIGSAGYLLGLLVLAYHPNLPLTESFRALLTPPERATWVFLVSAQVSLWALLAVPLYSKLREYRGALLARPIGIVAFLAGFGAVLSTFLISHQTLPEGLVFPVHAQQSKIGVITIVGAAVMMVALGGIYGVSAMAARLLLPRGSAGARVAAFLTHRKDLRSFLTTAGLVVGAATLSTGALHRALAALNAPELFAINPTMILLYGAFGSGVVALVYVPAHLLMNDIGHRIADSLCPPGAADAESVIRWHREREELVAVMDLKTSAWDNLRSALSLLYPLIGSAISLLLGLGG